ncbi:NUDIX hydrolase [Candidatus Saccharibacteria bacterium]|jgi:ADP-ribose pyrophosphatase YjhB (NUDIX family)|nr:NUDIX hydrolase [Candidatus Saccharibacteria bacterium]
MNDRRIVKLLVRNLDGDFLVLRRSETHSSSSHLPDLPGGHVEDGESDIATLDRRLRDELGLFLQTQEAVEVGFDAEYEPGEGLVTVVLYLIKINQSRLPIRLSDDHEGFDWVNSSQLRSFDPPLQVLVQTALDFYVSIDE